MDVISLGQLVIDIVVKPVDRFPQTGTADLIQQIELHSGGCALNTAITMGILGVNVGAIGKIGSETFGDFLISDMKKHGVNPEGVRSVPSHSTSSAIVLASSEGERSFLYCPGANEELTIDDVDFRLIEKCKILHVGGAMKLLNLDLAGVLEKAKGLSVTTSLDTDWDPSGRWLEILEPCLGYVDIFTPSIDEAKEIFGTEKPEEIADAALSYGIKIVAVKMGKAGCYVKTNEEEHRVPAFEVDVVDSTGAGDAFVGGLLAGIVKGWNLHKAGEFAAAVGAQCVTSLGATTGVKSFDKTLAFMENYGNIIQQ